MSTIRSETNIINAERQRMTEQMTEQLAKLGVEVRIDHFTGDSSYPTEYTISGPTGITEVGPTFDLALTGWIKKLVEAKNSEQEKQSCAVYGVSTQMADTKYERKVYLMNLHDSGKDLAINLQVFADGRIMVEPRAPHELDYDDLDADEEDDDDECIYVEEDEE